MPQLLTSTEPERDVRALYAIYDRIVVRVKYLIEKRVYFRANLIADLPCYILKNWIDRTQLQFHLWQKDGGILLLFMDRIKDFKTMVHVHTECPISLKRYQKDVLLTSELAVVPVPASWREHEITAGVYNPPAVNCKRMYQALVQLAKKPHTSRELAILERAGLVSTNVVTVSDETLSDMTDFKVARISSMRKRLFGAKLSDRSRFGLNRIYSIIPRVEPEDPGLLALWQQIKAEPDCYRGERMMTRNSIANLDRYWRRSMAMMKRAGNIEWKPVTFIYPLNSTEPDWKQIEAEHKAGAAEFKAIRSLVEKAPSVQDFLKSRPSAGSP